MQVTMGRWAATQHEHTASTVQSMQHSTHRSGARGMPDTPAYLSLLNLLASPISRTRASYIACGNRWWSQRASRSARCAQQAAVLNKTQGAGGSRTGNKRLGIRTGRQASGRQVA